MFLKQELIVGFLCLLAGQATAGECVEVVEHKLGSPEPAYQHVWLEWQARLHNQCDHPYYTLVTLWFRDSHGKAVQKSVASSMIKEGDTKTLKKRSFFEKEHYEQVVNTDIELRPKALPGHTR